MSRSTLNLIATVLFVIAAVLFFITGSWILGAVFSILALLSLYQVQAARSR